MSLRDSLLTHTPAVVPVQWGGTTYYVRSMTGKDRDSFESETWGPEGEPIKANLSARVLMRTLCDEAGARLFTDAEAELVGALDGALVSVLFNVAWPLCRIGKAALEQAKNG